MTNLVSRIRDFIESRQVRSETTLGLLAESAKRVQETEAEIEELRQDIELLSEGINPLVYCELCGSCGEDGCCPPERCLLRKAEAERDKIREAFYYSWSRRPLLGKQWDGESDPLPMTLAAMETANNEAKSAWVLMKDRLPTREDADERAMVWTYCVPSGEVELTWYDDVGGKIEYSHWMPKLRQQPPARPKGE